MIFFLFFFFFLMGIKQYGKDHSSVFIKLKPAAVQRVELLMWMVWKKKENGVTIDKIVFSDEVRKALRKWDLCMSQSEWNLSFCTIILSRYLLNPCSKTTCDSVSTNIAWLASESITILARQFSTLVACMFTSPWLFLFPGALLRFYPNLCLHHDSCC